MNLVTWVYKFEGYFAEHSYQELCLNHANVSWWAVAYKTDDPVYIICVCLYYPIWYTGVSLSPPQHQFWVTLIVQVIPMKMVLQPMDVHSALRLHVHRGTLLLLNAVSHCGHTRVCTRRYTHLHTWSHSRMRVSKFTFSVHYTYKLCIYIMLITLSSNCKYYFTDLTAGELAAIIVVCAIVFFGSVCGFTFGCLFYWYRRECRPQRRYQVRVNAELSRRQSSDLPTSSQQSCQKPVLSDLDPPTYQQELDKEASSSAPPAYEDWHAYIHWQKRW